MTGHRCISMEGNSTTVWRGFEKICCQLSLAVWILGNDPFCITWTVDTKINPIENSMCIMGNAEFLQIRKNILYITRITKNPD